jgi:hypothetical protein
VDKKIVEVSIALDGTWKAEEPPENSVDTAEEDEILGRIPTIDKLVELTFDEIGGVSGSYGDSAKDINTEQFTFARTIVNNNYNPNFATNNQNSSRNTSANRIASGTASSNNSGSFRRENDSYNSIGSDAIDDFNTEQFTFPVTIMNNNYISNFATNNNNHNNSGTASSNSSDSFRRSNDSYNSNGSTNHIREDYRDRERERGRERESQLRAKLTKYSRPSKQLNNRHRISAEIDRNSSSPMPNLNENSRPRPPPNNLSPNATANPHPIQSQPQQPISPFCPPPNNPFPQPNATVGPNPSPSQSQPITNSPLSPQSNVVAAFTMNSESEFRPIVESSNGMNWAKESSEEGMQ